MIHAVAGAVMLAGWLFVSFVVGNFEVDGFAQTGFFVLALACGYWLLSRLAAKTLARRPAADCEPDAGSP